MCDVRNLQFAVLKTAHMVNDDSNLTKIKNKINPEMSYKKKK